MRWIKGIIKAVIVFIQITLLTVLAVSMNIRTMLVDGIIKETIKNQIGKNYYQEENVTNNPLDEIIKDERIQEILNTKEIQELINKYLDIIMNGLTDEESLEDLNLEEDMIDYIEENKDVIEEVTKEEITDEMLEELRNQVRESNLNESVKKSIESSSNSLTETEKTVLKGYKVFTSFSFKAITVMLILLSILILGILEKSFYKWIKTFGKSLITSGILVIIMSLIVRFVISLATNTTIYQTNSLLYTGIFMMTIGIFIIILYRIIEGKRRKDKSYDIS